MRSLYKPGFLGFVALLLVASCESPSAPPEFTVGGEVVLFNELGGALESAEGVSVGLLGPGDAELAETSTDPAGRFSLDLPYEGEFSLVFRKEGFGTTYHFGVAQDAGSIEAELFAQSTASVTSVMAAAEECGTVPCLHLVLDVENFPAGNGRRVLRIFLSSEAGISPEDYEVTDLLFVTEDDPGLQLDGTTAHVELDGVFGMIESFPSGSLVHVLVRGATENLNSGYVDPDSGVEVFTDLSPVGAQDSFIMP